MAVEFGTEGEEKMCVMSVVHDHYGQQIPTVNPDWWITETSKPFKPAEKPALELSDLARLIQDFRELVAAAKLIDDKTGQPDCVDPVKAQLEARVAELEKLLAAPPEFVIVSGGKLEPGRYRVIDGKLYRAVDGGINTGT
jgi:hypothetical protein